MAYVFDTNTILEAKNRYYGFDICPAFWEWLILEKNRGNVLSIEAVRQELEDPDADTWGKNNRAFFEANDDKHVGDVAAWVNGQARFTAAARTLFLGKADPRLISFAKSNGHTLVTQEVPAPQSRKVVKIPDVCKGLGVAYKNCFEVLNELNARFVLEVPS